MRRNTGSTIAAKVIAGALAMALLTGCGAQAGAAPAASEAEAAEAAVETTEEAQDADAAQSSDGDKIVVRASTGGAPAPYITVDDDDNLDGFDIAVFNEVFSRLPQYEVEWTVTSDSLTGVLSGLYDVSVNNWAYRPERAESYYYSYPYKFTDTVFVTLESNDVITSLDDIYERGYKTEVGAGDPTDWQLQLWNEENPDKVIEYDYISNASFLLNFQRILDGYTDFWMGDSPIYYATAAEFGLEGLRVDYIESQRYVYTYFLIRKDEQGAALREDINRVLLELHQDGTLKELSEKYFGTDVTPGDEQYETTIN
ncbi:MAG: transporter substrate-binding domain-containing protein [Lachnospiraceae bacterium]|nr:transporter substrate-binding domain-containing protein [Lachnospiraceae bacterium]